MPAADEIEPAPAEGRVATTEILVSYRAPLPPPSMLAGYENVLPGSADRIMSMAALHADIQRSHAGLFMGFIVTLAFFGGSLALIVSGKQVAGLAIGLTDLAVIVGVFVYGSLSRRGERQRKADLLSQEPYEPLEAESP